MPANPRYGRRKRQQQRARTSVTQGSPAVSPPAAAAPAPAVAPAKPAIQKKAPAPPPRTYPFVGGELKAIGILTAAVFVILAVLALVLR